MSRICAGLAAHDTSGHMVPFSFDRRAVGEADVLVDIHYSGICHSDLHQARGEWGNSLYPMVPGHEMAGIVSEIGSHVTKFHVGDRVGVGVMVDSCRHCDECKRGEEQYCKGDGGCHFSYNYMTLDGTLLHGGYSKIIVVDENYVVRIPDALPLDAAAPLLCAGITTYSPLVYFGARQRGASCNVGVAGFGGLGHMAAKFAVAMHNHVTIFSTSPAKAAKAAALGCSFVCTSDKAAMRAATRTIDLMIDTISGTHKLQPYIGTLKTNGNICVVGLPVEPFTLEAFDLIGIRGSISSSGFGGIQETQEMLDFCALHGIVADIQVIGATEAEVNAAHDSLASNSSSESRFVIKIVDSAL